MGDQSNSTYINILLENKDSDIPIALNFTTPPKVTQAEDNQVPNYFRCWKIHWWKIRHKNLKTVMRNTAPFSSLQCSWNSYVREYIATLKEQI